MNKVGTDTQLLYVVLYAPSPPPNGKVEFGTKSQVSGSIVGTIIDNKNMIIVNYNENVTEIPGLPGGNVTSPEPTPVEVEVKTTTYTGAKIDWYKVLE